MATNRDTFLVQQMHALAIAIYQAKQRNEPQTVAALLERFELLADEYRSRGATDLTAIDKFVLVTGQYIGDASQAAKDLVQAAAREVGKTAGAALDPLKGTLAIVAVGLVAVAFIMGGGIKTGRR